MNFDWFFVTFDSRDEFLGGCYVDGPDKMAAFLRCLELGLDVGGDVWRVEITGPIPAAVMKARDPESEYRYRLLPIADESRPA